MICPLGTWARVRGIDSLSASQIVGVAVFALCLLQMSVGTFIRLRSSPNAAKTHPPRNVVHVLLGLIIIVLALYEVSYQLSRLSARR